MAPKLPQEDVRCPTRRRSRRSHRLAVLVWIVAAVAPLAAAQNWDQLAKLLPPPGPGVGSMGDAAAASGDVLAVGAIGHGTLAGAVYVYENAAPFPFLQTLVPSDPGDFDFFGASLAIDDGQLAVGAPTANVVGEPMTTGVVYLFERDPGTGTWSEVRAIVPPDGAFACGLVDCKRFGQSVALEGGTLLVGADQDSPAAAGSAYVFERAVGGADAWGFVTKIIPADLGPDDHFGAAVALSGDVALVGAPGQDGAGAESGAVYVFARDAGGADSWGQVAKLLPPSVEAGDFFGLSVALAGSVAAVGAPFAHDSGAGAGTIHVLYQGASPASWNEIVELTAPAGTGAQLGSDLALLGDRLAGGAPRAEAAGVVFVYERNAGGTDAWGLVAELRAVDRAAEDRLGGSVALSGGRVLAGAPGANPQPLEVGGAAYVFGDQASVLAIPAMGPVSLALLAMLLVGFGLRRLLQCG